MSAYKFACPKCQQHIECDEQYAGLSINCPACQNELVVPSRPPAPTPAVTSPSPPPSAPASPIGAPKLSVSVSTASPPRPAGSAPAHSAAGARPRPLKASGLGSKTKSVLVKAAVVVTLVVGLVLAVPVISRKLAELQEGGTTGSDQAGRRGGHLAELNTVMDATEDLASGGGAGGTGALPTLEGLPLVPPVWTTDLQAAQIPETKVNGTIAGVQFIVEDTSLVTGGVMPALAFRQGGAGRPYRELLIYLDPQPGGALEDRAWTVTAQGPAGQTRVIKRWREGGNTRQETFASGYALRLDVGRLTDGVLPGKLFLALPDADQSVVAGLFQAAVRPVGAAQTTATPQERRGTGMGADAGPRRGPPASTLKQRARELGADRNE